jgi:hypothetical protein
MVLRGVGLAATLHAIGGLAIGVLSVAWFAALDPDRLDDATLGDPCDPAVVRDRMSKEECRAMMDGFDAAAMRKDMASPAFRRSYAGFVAFGILVNVCLLYVGRLLWKAQPRGAAWLAGVSAALVGYWCVFRLVPETGWGLSVAAATGIGNMGLAPLIFTWFWLWGPALAVVAMAMDRRAAATT